jgi:hypothetical protein
MAGARKHGVHRYSLTISALAVPATAADETDMFVYDAYADAGAIGAATGGSGATGYVFPYDATAEEIFEACFVVGATLTGQATNYANIVFRLIRAGAVLNDLRVAYSGAGVTTAAFTVVSFAAASGATLLNAGTGVLTVTAGSVLPWTLQPGDIIQFGRISTGSGLATPDVGCTFATRQKGA